MSTNWPHWIVALVDVPQPWPPGKKCAEWRRRGYTLCSSGIIRFFLLLLHNPHPPPASVRIGSLDSRRPDVHISRISRCFSQAAAFKRAPPQYGAGGGKPVFVKVLCLREDRHTVTHTCARTHTQTHILDKGLMRDSDKVSASPGLYLMLLSDCTAPSIPQSLHPLSTSLKHSHQRRCTRTHAHTTLRHSKQRSSLLITLTRSHCRSDGTPNIMQDWNCWPLSHGGKDIKWLFSHLFF